MGNLLHSLSDTYLRLKFQQKMHVLYSRKFGKYTVYCFVSKTAGVMHTKQHNCISVFMQLITEHKLHAALARRVKNLNQEPPSPTAPENILWLLDTTYEDQ